ncbi:hypothetical protein EB809_01165 [Marinobacter sp. R17]|uniref:hypothetical protein n=1 Tax=Marinobacter TaxID=2742 RepID=UPI000F4B7902|nr:MULTISPECIES: hypothetical protein [Marinobacter]ROU02142.1 hypothetical protein EB809_01165 [Marinobacter sp. R17]
MSHAYKPIDCAFHDALLEAATLRRLVEIVFRDEAGQIQTFHDRIRDVFTRAGEEFLVLERGQMIRLDHLLLVDGRPANGV